MKHFFTILGLFISSILLAQPANDNCSTAQAIGSLPTPAACPSGVGASTNVAGTLNGATAANPYTYQGTGCTGSSTTMAAPAIDVWYTFVATGYQLNMSIAGTVANPNIAVYSGTCGALGGGVGGCAVGNGAGNATLTVFQMVIGQTYYVQVSGNSATATGNFTLTLNNSIDCNNCLGGSNLTVNPLPTNGAYPPGTTVNFCFKVNSYTQVNTNWLHGVQLTFGSGWNLGSLTTTPPPACQGTGSWAYYPAGITDNSGQAWPAGFYFETTAGATNPGNNFGDNCQGNINAANWNFCFSITTAAACTPGSDLSVVINTSGDGESGSWTSLGCSGDPATNFSAIGACCPPTMSSTPVSCFGGSDGTATATPVGTQNPYIYTWTNSSGTVVSTTSGVPGANTATGLPAGIYTVSVSDNDNCVATNTVNVTQPTQVTLTLTPTNATCGSSNGSISAGAGGGTPGYNYQINGGGYAGTSNFPGLGAGTYTVDVQDNKGCTVTATVSITSPSNPTVNVNSGTICNSGSITLTATGATTYSWSPGTGLSGTTGASVTANPGATTVYTVTGTTGGCAGTATSTVTVVSTPTVVVNSATICNGQQTATLTASGATTYSWTPAAGLSATTGTTVNATPTVTTTYTITGTAGTCTDVATSVVTVNPLPTVAVNNASICLGQQTATLTATGATTYTWSPASGLSSTNGTPVTATPTVSTFYSVTGTDGNGCTGTATSNVVVNPLPTVSVNNGIICNGGSIALNAGGASTYSWSPGTGLSATTGASVNANPATTTQYTVTGTDINGCINDDTTTVTVVSNPTVTVTSGTICAGQTTATLTANGASTYVWSPGTGLSATTGSVVTANPGATTTYTITGTVGTCTAAGTSTVTVNNPPVIAVNSGTICVGQGNATLTANGAVTYTWMPGTGLSATTGASVTANPTVTTTYTIGGVDANGCVNATTANVLVHPLPNVTVNGGLICAGGSMTLTANGATTYSWTPGTGLSATTGASVTANPATTTQYTVIGVDANGCVNGDSATVTVVNNPTVTATSGTICVGQGTTTLTASGATTYTWSPATGLSSTTGSAVLANPNATTVYTITGTVGTCTASGTTTVTVNSLPTITAGSNSPVCVNQTLNLSSSNGISYGWSGPNSFSTTTQNPSITGVSVAAMGTYTVIGVDANGCINTNTVAVVINPLPVVTATGATVCLNATINLSCTPNGATGYSWSGPGYSSNSQNPSIPGATTGMAGNYVVTVTDGNGCVNANVATVAINSLPIVSATTGTICAGQTTATINASGANTYAWSPATGLNTTTGASVVANPNTTTVYSVTGTDINGCQGSATTTVSVNPVPAVSVTPQNSSGCAPVCTTFSNTASSSGNYSWSFGDGSTSQSAVPYHCFTVQGNYNVTLTLTDNNGCVNSAGATVNVYPVPKADFTMNPQPTSILEPSIQFYDGSYGANLVTWNWTFGDYSNNNSSSLQNPAHQYGDTGSYVAQLVVVSDYGCKDSTIRIVRIEDDYALYIPNAFSPNSDGTNDVFKAVGSGVKEFKLFIFDRWGNQVFFSDKLEKGWDGRYQAKGEDIVQEDVYVWKIEAKTTKNEKKQLAGVVSLLK